MMRSQNPTQLIAQLASQNPQVRQVIQLMSSGGNPQQLFEQMARQRGVDPNWAIKQLLT